MAEDQDTLSKKALSIAAALAASSPGDKADSRRMGASGSAFFWRQIAKLDVTPAQEAKWMQFTRLVALLTPATRTTSIHDSSSRLGAALAAAGYSEQRLARLLAARDASRDSSLERAIRMLATSTQTINVSDLAFAVFSPRNNTQIARDYYRELDRSFTKDAQDE